MNGEIPYPEEAQLARSLQQMWPNREHESGALRVDVPSGNAPLAKAGLQRHRATPGGAVLPVVPMRGD